MSRHAPAAELPRWMDWGLMPLLNLAMALLAAAGVMAAIGQDPWMALQLMVKGAFGDPLAISYTLYYTTNFIFTGLAVCVALHAGHFNIGGEGQAMMGGLAVGAVMLTGQPHVPAPLLLPLAVLAGVAAGAAWAGVPGYLQAKRGSHVVITTIMFNFIASALMVFLVGRFFRVPGQPAVESHPFAEGLEMPAIYPLLNQWGIEVPSNPLNASVLLALLACVGVWLLLWKTRLGYELRALGASPDAARYAGMNPAKLTVLAMALSGGLAAMVGVNEIAGVHHKLLLDFTAGAGFTGIAVSLMGRNHPVGIVLAALLFGALYQGGAELAFELPSFTRDMVVSIQGLVVLFSGALALMLRPTVAWLYGGWLSLKKPSTATQEA